MKHHIDIIATTISGSIKDWGKVKRIVPLFQEHGENNVRLYAVDSHAEARIRAGERIRAGSRILISAGGSGTFNSVLEGCYDAHCDLRHLRLGFLRKGSADLIGKVLGMPDDIQAAIPVFVRSIRGNHVVPCDVLRATTEAAAVPPRHFVGYGGAELFGEIPYFTENRFIKYYKGALGQLFGDLGPFFVGAQLAVAKRLLKPRDRKNRPWQLMVDDQPVGEGAFQAIIIVNGDLGPNLPFARSVPLGSGDFHVFTLKDLGMGKLFGQLRHAWDASIMEHPARWGFERLRVTKCLQLRPAHHHPFPLNIDGSTMECRGSARIEIIDRIQLLCRRD